MLRTGESLRSGLEDEDCGKRQGRNQERISDTWWQRQEGTGRAVDLIVAGLRLRNPRDKSTQSWKRLCYHTLHIAVNRLVELMFQKDGGDGK